MIKSVHRIPDSIWRFGLPLLSTARLLLLLVVCLSCNALHAQTWTGGVGNNWNIAGNWIPANVPESDTETAVFGVSTVLDPTVTTVTNILGVTFNAGASAYNIQVNDTMYVGSGGMVNNSGVTQTVTINNGVFALSGNGNGGTNVHYVVEGAGTAFQAVDSSSLGSSVITNNGRDIQVAHNATGESARVILNNGRLLGYMSSVFTLGSLEGSGNVEFSSAFGAASTQTLSLGHLNTSTAFSGVIGEDGITLSLVKVGTGTFTLTGSNTYTGGTIISGGALQIGDGGTSGSVTGNILNNASLIFNRSNNLSYGGNISGTGILTKLGTGTLTLTGSTTYTGGTIIKAGTLAVATGGSINHSGTNAIIGDVSGDNGVLLISGGLVSDNNGYIGNAAGSMGSVTVSSGTWSNSSTMLVGNSGTGTLNLEGTGVVEINSGGGTVTIGSLAGSNGTLNIGTGGVAGTLQAAEVNGGMGGGVVNFSHTGQIFFSPRLTGSLSVNKLAAGTTVLTGSNTYSGSTTVRNGSLMVSGPTAQISHSSADMVVGSLSGDNGRVLLGNGSSVTNFRGIIADAAGSTGRVDVPNGIWTNLDELRVGNSGDGTFSYNGGTVSNTSAYLGYGSTGSGTVFARNGSWTSSGTMFVGYGGQGNLSVEGGAVSSQASVIGANAGSSGTATVTSGTWSVTSSLTVGGAGTGTLAIDGGRVLVTGTSFIGDTSTGFGSVTVNSGSFTTGGRIRVGNAGMGSLSLNGGSMTSSGALIGAQTTGSGTVTVTSGTWLASGSMEVGSSGQATLQVNGGRLANGDAVLGNSATGRGDATVSSGTWNSLSLTLGASGTGILNLNDTGVVSVNSGSGAVAIAQNVGSTGTLNIGTGAAAGSLLAGSVSGGSGTATVNFNHTGSLTFAQRLTGNLAVNKLASGTTVLTGNNTYTGPTSIQVGTLVVNGVNSGTGAVTVQNGAALAGSGTMAGAVTVNNGGILKPGTSPGTLTVGGLILDATSDLQFELGTNSDLVVVQNDLTLDGILNVTDSGGFGLGSYTLFQYSGALTNNGLTIGMMPSSAYLYIVDLSQAGYVRLTVAPPELYWDGSGTTPNGTVNGGDGTWDNTTTNWTTASGSSNFAWNSSGTAHFTGTAGTVNVADTINVADIIFETDGYALTGTGALAISGSTLTVNTGSGVTAGIATQISGSGALVKTGADGTLVLSGSNSYTGDTLIEGGVLQVTGVVQNSSNVYVGYSNSDTGLLISNGGSVTDTSATIGVSASAQNNIATVTGSNSTWTSTGDLNVGFDGNNNALNIADGGAVFANYLKIGGGALSTGNRTLVTGTNSLLTTINDLLVGYGGTSNTLAISNGGRVVNTNAFVGYLATANGNSVTVSGPNSLWTNNGTLYLGDAGSGNSIMVSNGGNVIVNGASQDAVIGLATTSTGNTLTVTGTGSVFSNASTLYVGRSGGDNGMDILSGGLVTSHNARVGGDATSNNNLVNVDGAGSLWNGGGTLRIGSAGSNNALNISNGGAATMAGNTFIGYSATATNNSVSVDGAGSSLSAGALIIGRDGAGSIVTASNGGTVTSSTITLGANAGSGGILQIGNGGAAGSVNSTEVTGGAGAALVSFNHTGLANFSPRLSGGIAVNKLGSGTTVLSGANSYTQGTAISDGVLQTTTSTALGTGAVALSAGALAPVGPLNIASLTWNGGTLAMVLGTNTSFLNIAGNLTLTGVGQFDFTGDSGFMTDTQYAVLAAANLAGFSTGSFAGSTLQGVTPTFTLVGNTLYVSFLGANSGPVIQNSGPYFTPRTSDFQVNGPVRTGSPTESNTVNSLTFADGSSVAVFNNLTVTSGNFNVATGIASMTGGNVIVPGALNLNGQGTLIAGSNFAIGGDANINGGNLIIDGLFTAGGAMNVNSTVTVNGSASVAGSLNTNASVVTVNGGFTVGGDANLNNGTDLLVNAGGLMAVGQATNINFGSTAVINGQLASPQVNVNGLLKGAGLIAGNVWNNGTVAPGNSPGTLSINGNYTQTGNGTLEIEPGDLLWVSGNASLAGTLKLVAAGKLQYGQQITFLQAGSISGEFDQILVPNPAKNRGRPLVDGGTGTLLIAPTSYTLVAETGNQRNVAKALDSFIPARGNDRETVSIALDLQLAEQYPAAFDQIAPTFYESLADITIEQTNAQNQNLAQRASALRLGARGFQASGIEAPLVHDKDGKSVMDAKDGKNILSHAPDNKWGVWVQGNGNFARITSANQVPNYRFESGGFLAGADYRWSENFVTGLYGGYQGTLAKYNEGGRTTINSVQFGGYASYDNGGFYADAIVGGGYSAYEVRRPINFSTIDRTARSRPDGGQFTTYLDLGYDWKLGNFTVGPILSGQYTYAGIAPFTETGADSLDLSVGQQNANSLRTSLGGRIAYTWKVSEKFTLIPEGRMFWQHEFLENPRNIGGSLDGGNGPSFGYTTSTPDRDAIFAGAGLIGQFGPNWNAYFYYNADFGRQDYISHAISTGLNFKF